VSRPAGGTGVAGDPTAALDRVLTPEAARWLAERCAEVAEVAGTAHSGGSESTAWRPLLRAFPAVGRHLGRGPLRPGADPADVHAWTVDDAGRVRLLRAAAGAGAPPAGPLDRLYAHGDAAERRAVLRALDVLPVGEAGLPLLRDALRTNDTRLVAAAAAGTYAAGVLPAADLEQAVLKCLFVGVPLAGLAALPARLTPALATMVAGFARERVAAGRSVPVDAWLVLDRYPEALPAAGLPAELHSPRPDRRAAAERFLGTRAAGEA
jgi:hypothetical protein